MKTKRSKFNEIVIRMFLKDLKGYSASFNGEQYFKLEDSALYGGPVLKLRNDMGWTVLHLTDNDECIEGAAMKIQETLLDLDNIIQREKEISEYCLKNPWTRSGT